MSSKFDSYQKLRLRTSFVSVVVSITLVLLMVGVLGLVLLKSTRLATIFKEQIPMVLFLKDDISKENIENLRESLLKEDFTREIVYITKEAAAKAHSKELGEDFLKSLGANPLKSSIDLYLKAEHVTPEKMAELEKRFQDNAFVSEVSYHKPTIELLTKVIQEVNFWLVVLCTFFGVIAVFLINSSIRLSIYSKRFNIKTMQMVGATRSFITRPFIRQSLQLGSISAVLALAGLFIGIYYLDAVLPDLNLIKDYIMLVYLGTGVLVIAFLITWLSTFFAARRFLNLQTDELYH